MILGRVTGQVWATKKNRWLRDKKLLIVKPYFWYNPDHDCDHVICVDPVGAEIGEDVLVCVGLPARWQLGDIRHPVEASIMAIVDRCEFYRDVIENRSLPFSFRKGEIPATAVII
jgi:ethanolamine utilization protein EutN